MDINISSEVTKIITQGAFKASEVSNETLRKKKIRETQHLSLNEREDYHYDSEINVIFPIDELKDDNFNSVTISKVKHDDKNSSNLYDINLHDPKLGKNIDIER
ncbi:hypothetical protein [Borrelia crocidurae]|uniref:Uncharacterized protein n=1 Tax=Borrelia crocidurae (strain Achema) TaxID=1155096 RepID=I0FC43_BORCA|nr:hypothetical protein [Borrelia crocidurae]AFI31049.1 hypothetical protein Q7M_270 [Borrelia crocidurae str. Achema]